MTSANSAPSPFAWETFAPRLLEALAPNSAEAFCRYWFTHLRDAVASAVSSQGDSAKAPWQVDYALYETYRSVALVGGWWLPAHDPERAEEAAEFLREAMQAEVSAAIDYLVAPDEDGIEPTTDDIKTAQNLEKLRADELFMARAALRLSGYKPNTKVSPHAALKRAVWDETGMLPDQPGRPKRTDLGRQLKRLFALRPEEPERARFDKCLARLSGPQLECIRTLYIENYLKLERKGWSGQMIDETRRAAIAELVTCMPELARFVVAPAQPKN